MSLNTLVRNWSEGETRYMLELYIENIDNVGPSKMYKTKKVLWKALSQKISEKFETILTSEQVEGRFKTIRQSSPYCNELNLIMRLDDSLSPQIYLSHRKKELKIIYPNYPSSTAISIPFPPIPITSPLPPSPTPSSPLPPSSLSSSPLPPSPLSSSPLPPSPLSSSPITPSTLTVYNIDTPSTSTESHISLTAPIKRKLLRNMLNLRNNK